MAELCGLDGDSGLAPYTFRAPMPVRWVLVCTLVIVPAAVAPCGVSAQSAQSGDVIRISRAAGPIVVDGDLSNEGWRGAARVEKWYEAQPGDNTEPKVRNVGYLTYDDRFLYAGFEFEDPDPRAIRAPYADRDDIGNGYSDYGGILLDPRNTGSS